MLEGASAKKWIDAYVEEKPSELAGIAGKLRELVKKTVAEAKESVNPWKIPAFSDRCASSCLGRSM